MPFGNYKDFAACVAASQDKSNPEAYCAVIHKQSTGDWPGETGELARDVLIAVEMSKPSTIELSQSQVPYQFKDNKLAFAMELIRIGEFEDKNGTPVSITEQDIDKLIEASKGVEIPIKLGHCSPEFVQQIADALELPSILLEGENGKDGKVRLGRVAHLYKKDKKLFANVEFPEKVASLVMEGYYNNVSVEMGLNKEQGIIYLSAISLLGATPPAIDGMNTLQSMVLLEGEPLTQTIIEVDDNSIQEVLESLFEDSEIEFDKVIELAGRTPSAGHPGADSKAGLRGVDRIPHPDKVWDVPFFDKNTHRQVIATVSAPDQITAKRTALRLVENAGLNFTGVAGNILGTTAGSVISWRLVTGKPILKSSGVIGRVISKIGRLFSKKEDTKYQISLQDKGEEGKMHILHFESMSDCVSKMMASGADKAAAEKACSGGAMVKSMEAAQTPAPPSTDTNPCIVEKLQQGMTQAEAEAACGAVSTTSAIESGPDAAIPAAMSAQDKRIKDLERQLAFSKYEKAVGDFTLIPGTPSELAEKLVKLEEKGGSEAVEILLETWRNTNVEAEKQGITTVKLSGKGTSVVSLADEIVRLQKEDKNLSDADAYKMAAKSNPGLHTAHVEQSVGSR